MRRKYQPQYNDKGERWCERCKAYHQSSNFSKESRQPDGLNRWCKGCVSVYQKKYSDEHREEVNARITKTRHKRWDDYLAKCRAWHDRNPEASSSYRIKLQIKHPGLIQSWMRTARAKRNKVYGHITAFELRTLWDQQGGKCAYCNAEMIKTSDSRDLRQAHVDHIHPISRGGYNVIENAVYACRKCNQSKSNLTIEEWKRRQANE